jgi:hypothetical protein
MVARVECGAVHGSHRRYESQTVDAPTRCQRRCLVRGIG